MSNRTDFDNVAAELQRFFGCTDVLRDRIAVELHDAFVAGQESREPITSTDMNAIERERDAALAEAKHWKDCHVARWEELAMAMNPSPTENPYEAARRVAADRELLSRDYAEVVRQLDAARASEKAMGERVAKLEEAFRMMRREALIHECGPTPNHCLVCNIISDADELAAPPVANAAGRETAGEDSCPGPSGKCDTFSKSGDKCVWCGRESRADAPPAASKEGDE